MRTRLLLVITDQMDDLVQDRRQQRSNMVGEIGFRRLDFKMGALNKQSHADIVKSCV